MIYTWKEILDNNPQHINIIWYGSLLNINTNSYDDMNKLKPVIVKWYKRIYNLKVIPDNYTEKWLENYKKYLLKYWVKTDEEIDEVFKSNKCVLNCEYTWGNNIMNWLLMSIWNDNLLEFSNREGQYNLRKTNFTYITPETWEYIWEWTNAYILIAKEEVTVKEWVPFLPYHENVQKWAYTLWKYFWKLFDNSTYFL